MALERQQCCDQAATFWKIIFVSLSLSRWKEPVCYSALKSTCFSDTRKGLLKNKPSFFEASLVAVKQSRQKPVF